MTILLNSTSGSSSANSYLSLEEANTYFETHSQIDVWNVLTDEQKKAALISATRTLDIQTYLGRRSTFEQSLSWPRLYIYDNDGYQISDVPKKLKYATAELVIWQLTEEDRLASSFELDSFKSISIGPITYQVNSSAYSIIPRSIIEIISSIGPQVWAKSGGSKQMVQ